MVTRDGSNVLSSAPQTGRHPMEHIDGTDSRTLESPKVAQCLPGRAPPDSGPQWWALLVGALRVYPHKHCANSPPQKDRGFARGGRDLASAAAFGTTTVAHSPIARVGCHYVCPRSVAAGSSRAARRAGM